MDKPARLKIRLLFRFTICQTQLNYHQIVIWQCCLGGDGWAVEEREGRGRCLVATRQLEVRTSDETQHCKKREEKKDEIVFGRLAKNTFNLTKTYVKRKEMKFFLSGWQPSA